MTMKLIKSGYRGVIVRDALTNHYGAIGKGQNKVLRSLGVESTDRAYHFAKNRSKFMRKFAPKKNLPIYFLFWVHAFCIYYMFIALKEKQSQIACAYFRGTWAGILKNS